MMQKTVHMYASYSAFAAGIAALAYAYFFVVAKEPMLYSLFLLLLGAFSLKTMVFLFGRVKQVNEDVARLAMIVGVIGAAGMVIHGGYDLANVINPPGAMNPALPNQVDPRGLLAFGFTGIAVLKFSWLMSKDKLYPKGLIWVGVLSGMLFVVIYVARLTVLSPANPVLLYPVLLNSFILSPLWYLRLGTVLKK